MVEIYIYEIMLKYTKITIEHLSNSGYIFGKSSFLNKNETEQNKKDELMEKRDRIQVWSLMYLTLVIATNVKTFILDT